MAVINSRACSMLFMAAMLLVAVIASTSSAFPSLEVDFYKETCPSAEAIVRQTVRLFVSVNPGLAAGLIRMLFHDCFVRGCDASVLLDSTPWNQAEKSSLANRRLRGYEVIYAAKGALEARCPGTVSCADVIAFAARDASYYAGGIDYAVPAGRRDGRVSLASDISGNIPPPNSTAADSWNIFAKKGLSLDEMVTLTGAHSIGRSSCPSFARRLYNFAPWLPQDPSLDPGLAAYLKSRCPPSTVDVNSTDPTTVWLDGVTPEKLDNQYYKNLLEHKGVLFSDQTLQTSPMTAGLVTCNAEHNEVWAEKFGKAMAKMASIDVLTGSQGEIRKICWVPNY
ncbi:peroxidase 5-like [Canna indica]|uniref:Peroxidase n=1 Tax=Canna indica TaxID=4628 RepID=A0AAQ3KK50_9LILI|nr:peroxidase 5-like [Canna indica]